MSEIPSLKLHWTTTARPGEHNGSGHVFIVKDDGKKLASIWGPAALKEKAADLFSAAPELLNGCNALDGLLTLLLARDDLPPAVREAMETSHRRQEARAAVAKATGAA